MTRFAQEKYIDANMAPNHLTVMYFYKNVLRVRLSRPIMTSSHSPLHASTKLAEIYHRSIHAYKNSLFYIFSTIAFWIVASTGQASALGGKVEYMRQSVTESPYASPIRTRIPHTTITPRTIFLAPMQAEVLKNAAKEIPGTPAKIGHGRSINELDSQAKFNNNFKWQSTPQGGTIAAVTIYAAQATGTRLGVRIVNLPATAILRFFAPTATTAFEISGASVLKLIQKNIDAGDSDDMARTYWGPFIDGENVTLEIELPAGVNPADVQIAIPKLSHFFKSPNVLNFSGEKSGNIGTSGGCELDAMCASQTSPENDAVGQMTYVQPDGLSYLCSGTLLNDRLADNIPYFLTANHCISKQSVATSLQVNWFFHSTSCNSGIVNPAYKTTYGGSTLLYASAVSDTSFMRLNVNAPVGAMFAGWDAGTPVVGAAVKNIHHPNGDLEKISYGTIQGFNSCTSDDPIEHTFSCESSAQPSGNYIDVLLTQGTTEGGSSGSGLFKSVNNQQYLIGQLRGGSSSCSNLSGSNHYGRFDIAYNAALSQWLDTGAKYQLVVTNLGNGNGTVTSSKGGINCGQLCNAAINAGDILTLTAAASTGTTFAGWSGACSGSSPFCIVNMTSAQNVSATFNAAIISVADALDNPSLIISNDPIAPFYGQISIFNFGGASAQTARITHSQSTSLSTVVQGPGTLTFDWKVSSEKDYDIFSVSVDGVRKYYWSGENNWRSTSLAIPSGAHTIQWKYSKDSSNSSGLDAGWLDHVAFTPANLLNNLVDPSFESESTYWKVTTASSASPFGSYTSSTADGLKFAWLCGYDNCADTVSQKVSIPSDATIAYLDFKYWVKTTETTFTNIFDTLTIEVVDALTSVKLAVVATFSNLDASASWQHQIIDLSQYIGKTINLVLSGISNSSSYTSFYLDPVKLMVDGSGGVESGWWWNPAEAGRGFAIEKLGNKIFMAGFLYSENGQPTWFTASGTMTGNVFTAPMKVYSNGQTLSGSYVAPKESTTSPGNVSLNFSDPTHTVMTWPGGDVKLQRFEIASGSLNLPALGVAPERGWWWNATEGGRGYAMEIQGDNMFIAGFMYDAMGQPHWYVSTGKMTDPQNYNGRWLEYLGGQTITGPYKAPTSNTPVANIGIHFSDSKNAKLTLPNEVISINRFTSF